MRSRFCIIGLGNPGPRYQHTRHNIGFDWLDAAFEGLFSSEPSFQSKYQSLYCVQNWNDCEIHFLKPQTFMNESGRAVAEWRSKNQGSTTFLVAYDEMDLPMGRLRLRQKGSDGGHRGMRSIVERLGTSDIPRLRIGIGRPEQEGARDEVVDYVLQKFHPDEALIMERVLADAGEQLQAYLTLDFEKAMNVVNSRNFTEENEA